MTWFAASALPRMPLCLCPPPLLRTDKRGDLRVTPRPCSLRSPRLFQVVTFHTLDLHQSELDQGQVLADVTVIADEVDLQLLPAVRCLGTPVA
jgi:hypothetical protein